MNCIALLHVEWSLLWERVVDPGGAFWGALQTTVLVAVVSQVVGVLLGLISALSMMSRRPALKFLAFLYIWLIRGTPVIVQIFFVYYGTNLLLGFDLFPNSVSFGLFTISGAVLAGIVALSINEGAYMSEIIRAGINSVDAGQMESAMSVGMTRGLAMRRVILPQAARVIVPPLGNDFNNMIKTTSLLAFIGVYDLFLDAQSHYSADFKPVENFAAVAIWYLILTSIWSVMQLLIERKLSESDRLRPEKSTSQRLFGLSLTR